MKRARVTWRVNAPPTAPSSTSASQEGTHAIMVCVECGVAVPYYGAICEGGVCERCDDKRSGFGYEATDSQLTRRECAELNYPGWTEWMKFADDELERFVEYLFKRVGSCEMEMYAWGQVGGGGWFGAYYFALARLQAIEAQRGAEWLDPIATRLRQYWDDVIEEEKRGMEAWQLAEDRATAMFPNNPEAREAFVEVGSREWRRLNYGEEPQRTRDGSEA